MSAIAGSGSIEPVVVVPAVAQTASGRTPAATSRADRRLERVRAASAAAPSIAIARTAPAPRPSMSAARRITTCASSDAYSATGPVLAHALLAHLEAERRRRART